MTTTAGAGVLPLESLTAIGPIDGRYRKDVGELAQYFSEFALMRARVRIEVEYLVALCEYAGRHAGALGDAMAAVAAAATLGEDVAALRRLYGEGFGLRECEEIKAIERETNHDVKAVEYFVKRHLPERLAGVKEMVHFGLTSQDINNTAYPLMVKEAVHTAYLPALDQLLQRLQQLAESHEHTPMLAHTHGQAATPTRLGKEVAVWLERLRKMRGDLRGVRYSAKFGGATGGLNAHYAAYPAVDWIAFANAFLAGEQLRLQRQQFTTQIEHYDDLAALLDAIKRINTVLVDLARDMWQYISMHYFSQSTGGAKEVGSSAMPHKINPIDFENAEGNCGLANALLEFMSAKLPVSRLQRDLTDSTVLRNLGLPLAHSILAIRALLRGLGKLHVNLPQLQADLDRNWAVVSEALQTILRRAGYPEPYEALKALTRHPDQSITEATIRDWVASLAGITEAVRAELLAVRPETFVGKTPAIATLRPES